MALTGIIGLLLAIWGPINEIIANVPQLQSNSVVHMIVNVIGSLLGAFKPKA